MRIRKFIDLAFSFFPFYFTLVIPASTPMNSHQPYHSIFPVAYEEGDHYNFRWVNKSFEAGCPDDQQILSKKEFEKNIIESIPHPLRMNVAKILSTTLKLSEWYNIDPLWVLAIMWVESHYDHSSISPVGAIGIMQVRPSTGSYLNMLMDGPYYLGERQFGVKGMIRDFTVMDFWPFPLAPGEDFYSPLSYDQKIFDPRLNVEMGIVYLKFLLRYFNDDPNAATMAYNMGPYGIRKELFSRSLGQKKNLYLEKVKATYQKLAQNFNDKVNFMPFNRESL